MIIHASVLLFLLTFSKANVINLEKCLNYTVYPVQYDLKITPYVSNNRIIYNCDLDITIIVNAPNVQVIELDAKDLSISSVEVTDGRTNFINTYRPYEFHEGSGKLFIYLNRALDQYSAYKTLYHIKICFVKYMKNDNTSGVYFVGYDEGLTDRSQKNVVVTRPSHNKAKYIFPCFNNLRFESVYKFKMQISNETMSSMDNYLVVANEQRRYTDNRKVTIIDYMSSPQISVHQVGFHISDFVHCQDTGRFTNDTLIIWASRRYIKNYDFILKFGVIIIDKIHGYSGTRRPLLIGPINIVAVPDLLDQYEIDSWNLLTIGEIRLAYVTDQTSVKQKEKSKFELAEQLCRIWLGNPGEQQRTRWEEQWFKEGLATYLAYFFIHQQEQWYSGTHIIEAKHKAMSVDWHHSDPSLGSFNQTLAVEIPPRYKELVNLKTASILWMVENWVTSVKFHQAIINYVKSKRGQTITIKDFAAYFDLNTVDCQELFLNGHTSSNVLNSWFNKPGYPVIDVQVLRDREPNVIYLKQHRFSFTSDRREDSNYLIPISYIVQNNQNCFNCYQPKFTIDKQSYTFNENLNGGWIILNRNASGYYRVNYDTQTWKLIAATLSDNHEAIDELNRAQIVNDVFALYAAGSISEELAMEILKYLSNEKGALVWQAVMDGYDLLKIEGARCEMTRAKYEEWTIFMHKVIHELCTSAQRTSKVFKVKIMEFAADIGYTQFDNLRKWSQRFDPDFREAVYSNCYHSGKSLDLSYHKSLFDLEDRHTAEQKWRQHQRFLYKIPKGKPTPLPIIQSTTSTTETPPIVDDKPNDASTNLISVVFILSSILVHSVFMY